MAVEDDLRQAFITRGLDSALVMNVPVLGSLTQAQSDAARALGGTAPLVVVEGAAGAGKTTVLKTAAELAESQDRRFVVVAPTLRAAQEVGAALGTAASSAHNLAHEHRFRRDAYGRWTRLSVGGLDPWTWMPYQGPSEGFRVDALTRIIVGEVGMIDQDIRLLERAGRVRVRDPRPRVQHAARRRGNPTPSTRAVRRRNDTRGRRPRRRNEEGRSGTRPTRHRRHPHSHRESAGTGRLVGCRRRQTHTAHPSVDQERRARSRPRRRTQPQEGVRQDTRGGRAHRQGHGGHTHRPRCRDSPPALAWLRPRPVAAHGGEPRPTGVHGSPTRACVPRSWTVSPSTAPSSKPAPTPTGSTTPALKRSPSEHTPQPVVRIRQIHLSSLR